MPKRQGPKPTKIINVVLMAAGALTLLIFVPHWVWTGFLAVLMISVGFLLYRF
jgi:hypothetical protein